MSRGKHSRHMVSLFVALLSFSFCVVAFLTPVVGYSEEVHTTPAEQVDTLLRQLVRGGTLIKASEELYKMGPEIDSLLLEKLKTITLAEMGDPANVAAATIATILSSRGYDKEILTIIKLRLRDNDLEDRLAAALMLTSIYEHYPLRDLSSIVSGKKDPRYLSEQLICQSRKFHPTVEEILELLKDDSDASRDLALALLKRFGSDCPKCGYSARKWKAFLEKSDTEAAKFLRSADFMGQPQELDGVVPDQIRTITASPDGKKIAFVAEFRPRNGYDTNLWVMDTSANRITKLQIPGTCYYASWSPKDNRILFTNTTSEGFNICTIRENGSEFCIWTKSFNAINQRAQWDPDSARIVFVKLYFLCPVAMELQVIDLTKNKVNSVARDNFCHLLKSRTYPTWDLSDGGDLLFWDCHEGDKKTAGLYVTSIADPGETRLLQAFDFDFSYNSLTISPDHNKIVYAKDYATLFIYDLATGSELEMHEVSQINSYPVWTPDGKGILFDDCDNVLLFSLDTGVSVPLAEGGSHPNAFGPQGKSIYYTKWDDNTNEPSIWRIDLDGTNDTKIFPVEGIEYTTVHPTPILKWAERD